jgi:alpha/beta superfamily hydrolase
LPRRIESLFIPGPAGRLEALLEEPESGEITEAALVCHPHPQHGGTMHNKVVYRVARGLRRSGSVVLRFNFRGVNLSEGSFGYGKGEIVDARAALAYLRERYPDLPYSMAGFSFGSRIILHLTTEMAEEGNHVMPVRLIPVGFPTIRGIDGDIADCGIPRYFVHSTNDVFGPKDDLQKMFDSLNEPKQLHFIEAEDHFFAGALPQLEDTVAALPR